MRGKRTVIFKLVVKDRVLIEIRDPNAYSFIGIWLYKNRVAAATLRHCNARRRNSTPLKCRTL